MTPSAETKSVAEVRAADKAEILLPAQRLVLERASANWRIAERLGPINVVWSLIRLALLDFKGALTGPLMVRLSLPANPPRLGYVSGTETLAALRQAAALAREPDNAL